MNTPRTDAFEKQRIVEAATNDIATEAWADFARLLERELNEAKKETPTADAVIWRDAYNDSQREIGSLRRQNERLREALITIHRVLTKDGVCFHCDAGDDVICAEAFDSVKQALAAQPGEKTK